MNVTGDELAGVVDTFGGLTRNELTKGLAELAFKEGDEHDPAAFEQDVDDTIAAYQLVCVEPATVDVPVETPVLVAGPTAFPTRPEHVTDLEYILDIEPREIDRERAGVAATERLYEQACIAILAGEDEELNQLIDTSYDIEAWAPVDLSEVRRQLDTHL